MKTEGAGAAAGGRVVLWAFSLAGVGLVAWRCGFCVGALVVETVGGGEL